VLKLNEQETDVVGAEWQHGEHGTKVQATGIKHNF
jgi:hypothetical protein